MTSGAERGAEPSPPRVVSSDVVFRGRVFDLAVDELELPGGGRVRRDIIRHPGAAAMIPIEPDGRIVMVRQYRHAIGRRQLEIPAGTLEPGEDRLSTVARELQEEVGLLPGRVEPFGGLFPAGSYTSEYISLYLCSEFTESALEGDEDEDIEVERWQLDDLLDLVDQGEIEDSKTVIALLRLARRFHR